MNVLVLYHATQTYTSTVFEHLASFGRFSRHRYFYCHHDQYDALDVDLSRFDCVVIHYCLRVAFDQVSPSGARKLHGFGGLKVLFLQDEYENTHRAWHWIRSLGAQLVFTVVPDEGIPMVYPPDHFPGVRFVSNITGYVPEQLPLAGEQVVPPSRRNLLVGYRGRPLPLKYGQLGREKAEIGRLVKAYCEDKGLTHDIAWSEESRIYGDKWYDFIASCRGMLGSESGSNVFDWDSDLAARIAAHSRAHPGASEADVYERVIAPLERPGLMNQVSPRVFEAISLRTALVLFEGRYSGVVEPWKHYIPLRKDGSNLGEVVERLQDGAFLDAMTDRAWQDVIGSGRYSYGSFIQRVDGEMEAAFAGLGELSCARSEPPAPRPTYSALTSWPARWPAPGEHAAGMMGDISNPRLRNLVAAIWAVLPPRGQAVFPALIRRLALPAWRWLRRVSAGLDRRSLP